jgi:hypothetical protein
VISDRDILRTANVLLQRRGGEALSYAAGKAADYAFKGDQQGALTWKRIIEAIRELRRVQPGATEQRH